MTTWILHRNGKTYEAIVTPDRNNPNEGTAVTVEILGSSNNFVVQWFEGWGHWMIIRGVR